MYPVLCRETETRNGFRSSGVKVPRKTITASDMEWRSCGPILMRSVTTILLKSGNEALITAVVKGRVRRRGEDPCVWTLSTPRCADV